MEETIGIRGIPADRRYHPEHLWVKPEGALVALGITDHLQDAAGAILYIQLPEVGAVLAPGESFCSLEAAKWVGHLPAPVGGRVAAVNDDLVRRPGTVNRDPYGAWLVRLRPDGGADGLLDAGGYALLLAEAEAGEGAAAR